jgi:hypothetical protein
MKIIIFTLILVFFTPQSSYAASLIGRLGIGTTNHLVSEMPAISLKLQRNRSTALGGHFGIDSSSKGVGYALGIKGYKYIYEEPQLNFYSALSGSYFTYIDTAEDTASGYQVDATFGAEFSFQGIESVGFSFEFGLGLSEYQNETSLKTIGHNMISSAVHFYL